MIELFLTLAVLTITEPAPGPAGAAALVAPTDANYRSLAPFDLTDISLLPGEELEVALKMASWTNPFDLENGFSHPIIEIYIGGGEFGTHELLPGSGMRLSDGEEWSVALRLTGDRAWGFEVTAAGLREFEPQLEMVDDWLYASTDAAAPESPRLAAMAGLYSPFHQSGWRPLADGPSPWAFSSETLVLPVVDVLALTEEAQQVALSTGVLPVTRVSTIPPSNTLWLALMAAGITLAGAGLLWRNAAGRRRVLEPAVEEAEELQVEEAAVEPARDAGALAAALVTADRQAVQAPGAAGVEPEPDADQAAEENQVKVGYFRGASQVEVEAARERLALELTAVAEPAELIGPVEERQPGSHDLDQVIDELRASILAVPEQDPESEEQEEGSGS